MKVAIGIDIGGTNTKIVLISVDSKKCLKEVKFKTNAKSEYHYFLDELSETIKSMLKEFKDIEIISGGIGIAGDVDSKNKVLRFSPNLNWRNIKLAYDLKRKTGIDYVMENDANMASWGAYELELNRNSSNIFVVTIGTGIGGGMILNGSLYSGENGSAGEIGHTIVEYGGRKCNCGNKGCLEAYCGSVAIIKRAKSLIKDLDLYLRKYGIGNEKQITTLSLSNAADNGDKIAIKIWEEVGFYLGIGLGNMILMLNPEYLILTGGVSKAARHFLPSMKRALRDFRIKTPFEKVKIKVSENPDLGAYGAALYGAYCLK